MSILIRDMEMPKNGEYKPVYIYDTGEVTMEIAGEEVQIGTAIEIQTPHGRLIDAERLKGAFLDKYIIYDDTLNIINDAPTIIESEGEE